MLHAVNTKDQKNRLDEKLRRELGEVVMGALGDDLTEDVVLNPDSSLWVNRHGIGWLRVGEMPPAQAQAA